MIHKKMHYPDLNKKMTKEEVIEDLRTDQEKRQDAFGEFVAKGRADTLAKIIFAGDEYKVRLVGRREQDDINLVKLKIIGNRHGMDGGFLEFNLDIPNDSELLTIY